MDSIYIANRTYRTLAPAEHLSVGSYLLISGVFVGAVNMLGLVAILKNRKVFGISAIAESSLLLGDLAVAGLHPFSGSSAIYNRWLWGYVGCQLYSFFGFLFGNFQMVAVPFIAFDRYIQTCETPFGKYCNARNYLAAFISLFGFALFWAAVPLFGWARFAMTKVQISCTIDWLDVNMSFSTYCTAYMIFIWILPLMASGFCYRQIYNKITNYRQINTHWINGNHINLLMLGRALVTPLCGLAYAAVCFAALAGKEQEIPDWLTVLPPVTLKFAGVINPFFYIYGNPQLFSAVKKLLGLRYDADLLGEGEQQEKADLKSTGVDPVDWLS